MPASMVVLIALTVVLAILAVYRWIVTHHEDDYLHLADPTGELVSNQRRTAKELKQVDRIGIMLTVDTALYGVGLLGTFLYSSLLHRPPM